MIKLLKIFILFVIFHATYNLINYLRYNSIEKLLFGNYTDDSKSKNRALTYKNTILNYIKYAGVKDVHIPITQELGYGQLLTGKSSVFENLLNPRQDFASTVYKLLLEAKGNYWSKFINSINPFYWIRFVLFIPSNLFSYLGIDSNKILLKIFQVIYWLIAIIFTFLISVFPEEIKNFVVSIIN